MTLDELIVLINGSEFIDCGECEVVFNTSTRNNLALLSIYLDDDDFINIDVGVDGE